MYGLIPWPLPYEGISQSIGNSIPAGFGVCYILYFSWIVNAELRLRVFHWVQICCTYQQINMCRWGMDGYHVPWASHGGQAPYDTQVPRCVHPIMRLIFIIMNTIGYQWYFRPAVTEYALLRSMRAGKTLWLPSALASDRRFIMIENAINLLNSP